MPVARLPLLRFALHLLLALAMLLQAHAAFAMHSTPPADVPPCHASVPDSGDADDGAVGELCRGACAQALSVPAVAVAVLARPMAAPRAAPLSLPALHWRHATPLRPPIA
jgi:hypothetical protein